MKVGRVATQDGHTLHAEAHGAGIPLVVIGSRRVPKSSEMPDGAPSTSSAISAPHIGVGLGTVALEASLW